MGIVVGVFEPSTSVTTLPRAVLVRQELWRYTGRVGFVASEIGVRLQLWTGRGRQEDCVEARLTCGLGPGGGEVGRLPAEWSLEDRAWLR
jgi:hypothetical protein